MKPIQRALACVLALIICFTPGWSQEREDRTLLSWDQLRAIINEASGERAMHTVLELVPYPRVRTREEYTGNFRESTVMAQQARNAGFSGVEIESFPSPGRSWWASQGELWITQPELRKIFDIHDVAISLATNSESGDVSAELIDVGIGARAEDFAGKDVTGKIVLGAAGPNVLQRLAVFERGAVGVVSYTALKPEQDTDQILSSSVAANAPQGKTPGFGWVVTPRVGRELAARLGRGEKVVLRSIVKSETFPAELEVVHAVIPGDGSSSQVVFVSAHLYEGYIKQGANDDNSGCAVTLEMGRTLIRLINEGKLPKPKRDIHFLWVPEISGTRAWLNKYPEIAKRGIADLNFDMEGLGLRNAGAAWVMHRTPDTFPSFLNDTMASILEFFAETNRERVRYRHNGYKFTWPVLAPTGSRDPFWVIVDKHFGASDHVTYMQFGIPAVIFVTWPDPWYHSSQDTPDKLDATQFKRVAAVGAAGITVLAAADDRMAAKILAESLARGNERLGAAQRKGLEYLADATDAAALPSAYRDAALTVRHQANVEQGVVKSVAVLFQNPAEGEKKVADFAALVDGNAAALQTEIKAFYALAASQHGVPATAPSATDLEKTAARLLVERVPPAGTPGTGGGGGFGAAQQALQRLPEAERAAVQAALRLIPAHMSAELNLLLSRKMTALEIRDFLSAEFEPLPLADLVSYVRAQEKLGILKLTEMPEAPAPAPAKPAKRPAKKS